VGFLDTLKGLFGKKGKARVSIKDRFSLETRIGQGSMSKVWRAYDRELGRRVCLKVLDREKTARFEARLAGLKKPPEGEICYALKHKNIVQTFDFGVTTEREQFLVMEMIEGSGLNFLIETDAPQLQGKRLDVLLQACEGMAYIHEHGYIHRDVCPRNIMVTGEGVVKFIDFGLAVPNTPEFRRPGNRTGTANYMAPELIKRLATDHRIDLFALGVTAFELYSTKLPWEGAQSLQTMLSHVNSPPLHIQEANPAIEDELAVVIMKGIERDPNDRYQTAAAFRDAVRRLAKED
jgi:serine/threonine protein kinase